MPLYEYQCDTCGHRFEVIQKFSDAKITECPKCQGAVHKLFSSPAIQFKGSGFYITDYAKKGSTGPGSSRGEGSGEKAGEKSGEKTGEKAGEKSGETSSEKASEKSSSSSDAAPKSDSSTKPTTPST